MEQRNNIDLSKINPLQQKRTLAFVNHFVMTNVQFMNNFMKTCESKLMQFERKLEKVNAAMVLLEARLSSIPEINVPTPQVKETVTEVQNSNDTESTATNDITNVDNEVEPSNSEVDKTDSSPPRPEYDKFIKMVQVGVPVQAVKLKVSLEGLDPNILESLLK